MNLLGVIFLVFLLMAFVAFCIKFLENPAKMMVLIVSSIVAFVILLLPVLLFTVTALNGNAPAQV